MSNEINDFEIIIHRQEESFKVVLEKNKNQLELYLLHIFYQVSIVPVSYLSVSTIVSDMSSLSIRLRIIQIEY